MLSLDTWNATHIFTNASLNLLLNLTSEEEEDYEIESDFYPDEDPSFVSLGAVLNESHPDYLELVNEHWLRQGAPSQTLSVAIGLAYLTLCLINNVSSILLFIVFLR